MEEVKAAQAARAQLTDENAALQGEREVLTSTVQGLRSQVEGLENSIARLRRQAKEPPHPPRPAQVPEAVPAETPSRLETADYLLQALASPAGLGEASDTKPTQTAAERLQRVLQRVQLPREVQQAVLHELELCAQDIAALRREAAAARGEAEASHARLMSARKQVTSAKTALHRAEAAESALADAKQRAALLLEMLGEKQEEVECLTEELEAARASFRQQMEAMLEAGGST
ncbi:unnamed protein product [Symbiodinium sp. KB8]|nr:unnamed protein product [Symbiodinium sp. KB8]